VNIRHVIDDPIKVMSNVNVQRVGCGVTILDRFVDLEHFAGADNSSDEPAAFQSVVQHEAGAAVSFARYFPLCNSFRLKEEVFFTAKFLIFACNA
jgi:hypothetical protein